MDFLNLLRWPILYAPAPDDAGFDELEKQLKGLTITYTARYAIFTKLTASLAYATASYSPKTPFRSRSTIDVDRVDGADSPFAVFQK
ncbi:MAG: hypothetical protein Q9172_002075 [Xanthocarpia lactea]